MPALKLVAQNSMDGRGYRQEGRGQAWEKGVNDIEQDIDRKCLSKAQLSANLLH